MSRPIGQADQSAILSAQFHMRPETVPNVIRKARRRGFLTGTVQGRSGGILAERAEQLIAGAPRDDPGVIA
jgi:acetolactate synthase regulatory subunit